MKIICSQESLLHGIQTVQKGISSRIGLPIYNGILFEANEDNKVHLFATDLEIGIDCYIPAQVIETGATVIPSRIISELIKKFPEGKIEIESSDNNIITVKENSSNYKILGFSAEEFSNFPEIKIKAKIKMNQKLFKETIQQVIFSTSRDENKTFLNGVLFKIIDNKIEIVTTDSHRLSLKNIKVMNIEKTTADELIEVIIPYRVLSELSRLLLEDEEVFVEIRFGEKQIMFILFPDGQKNSIRIYSRLIEGKFPNYHQIIPDSFKTEIKINTEEFRDKMERIALFVREDLKTVKVEVANKGNSQKEEICEIILIAENPSIGEASEKIFSFKKGEDITIIFNTDYILDVLKIIKKENTIIKLNDPLNPAIITPEEDKNYIYVLMPVRTD
ncbi:DNA polymerase III subunit beta [Candidatus Atribacteria bacterium RBG_16_35_8]|nr:MAG: DNA polymerase III subunit beta [Candidatus Atribacteria bacterium RBG_16_35_8]